MQYVKTKLVFIFYLKKRISTYWHCFFYLYIKHVVGLLHLTVGGYCLSSLIK